MSTGNRHLKIKVLDFLELAYQENTGLTAAKVYAGRQKQLDHAIDRNIYGGQ
jgi:hypothetical protein